MVDALNLKGGEKVLEIGAGSGYAAAVLSRIAGEVYTVERIAQLAEKAASRLADLGYANVRVLHGDGTLGWLDHAPYDAIVVAAGGPSVPDTLKQQLKIGGRLVIPVGTDPRVQELIRVTRRSETEFSTEDIADVCFVPLIGAEGWLPETGELASFARPLQKPRRTDGTLAEMIASAAEPFESIESAYLEPLLRRIGDARVVLIGEASHGTSEFYRMRERISRELIEKKGFTRGADRPLCAPLRLLTQGMDGVRPLPDLDVAKRRSARFRGLAAAPQSRHAAPQASSLLRSRHLQPLHVHPRGSALS
jgi:protein-L-isoaspartate(D-aspartate) O-methyltransferase